MSQFWSDRVRQLTPYVPGEQPKLNNLVKLNTNESPYGPSPRAIAAMQAAVSDDLRLYPDPQAEALKAAVAHYYELSPEQVFVGNGSDEILAHSFQALLQHEAPVLFPEISYGFYPVYCKLYQIEALTLPLAEDWSIRVEDYRRPNGGIVVANPNAPSGRLLSLAEIETLLQGSPESVVLIDEAYIDFGGESAAALVPRYPNLLVVQTLSKSRALAGLRVGFALGHPDLIEALERIKYSFNPFPLDRIAIAGAVAAIEDVAHFEASRQRVIATRERLTRELAALGFEVVPSSANFVFTRHPQRDAAEMAAALRRDSIIVRHFSRPGIDQYLRISVGTDEEIDCLLASLTRTLDR